MGLYGAGECDRQSEALQNETGGTVPGIRVLSIRTDRANEYIQIKNKTKHLLQYLLSKFGCWNSDTLIFVFQMVS